MDLSDSFIYVHFLMNVGIQKMVNNVLQLAPEMDKWKTTTVE